MGWKSDIIKYKIRRLHPFQVSHVNSVWRDVEAWHQDLDKVIDLCDKFIKQNKEGK